MMLKKFDTSNFLKYVILFSVLACLCLYGVLIEHEFGTGISFFWKGAAAAFSVFRFPLHVLFPDSLGWGNAFLSGLALNIGFYALLAERVASVLPARKGKGNARVPAGEQGQLL